ncbi:MAG: two-component regulator propeller domain-containing protein [Sideroxyarcus sp.]|nr:two-component regulator propeller domain-containing protein [Sideroxyarcus sp.]
MKLAFSLLCIAAWAVQSAVAGAENNAALPRVVETFGVGSNVYVRALTVEPGSNTLWVGTSAGVHEVDLKSGKLRNTFTRDSGLANEYVFAVGIDRQGYKWFGTNAGGTSRYRNGKWKTYFPMHGLADYWVYSFASQRNGDLWIGTWAGANRVDLKTMKFSTYVKELVNEWVYGIAVDARDRVWFGTEGGVSMFDGKTWRAWTHKDGLGAPNARQLQASPNTGLGTRSRHDLNLLSAEGAPTFNPNYVFSIYVAADQTVWAGTWGGGVSRFDGKTWTNLTSKDGLAGDVVYSIAQDRQGVLWFGTSNGLSRYDGKTWHNYNNRTGLPDNNVYAVSVTPGGDVWAGTKGGVARIALQ